MSCEIRRLASIPSRNRTRPWRGPLSVLFPFLPVRMLHERRVLLVEIEFATFVTVLSDQDIRLVPKSQEYDFPLTI